jgi:iron complex transport system substrate-binding protein
MRIVSLACSNTEIVDALGCSPWLVGVDDHSDFPEDVVSALPRVGPDLSIDVDRVRALAPDLVLASLTVPGHERVVEAVERAGLPVLTLAPEALGDVPDTVETIANAIADALADLPDAAPAGSAEPPHPAEIRARGRALAAALRAGFAEAAAPLPSPPSVLVQWWPKPVIAPGNRSWVQGMLTLAGARNALGHEAHLSRPLRDDEVAALAPDIILVSWCGIRPEKLRPEVVLRNPTFAETPAVRNGQVHVIPEALMGRPGPRLLEGIEALRALVRAHHGHTESSP